MSLIASQVGTASKRLAGPCVSDLVPYPAVYTPWSPMGDLSLDVAWWALLAGGIAVCVWPLCSLVRDGWGR